MKIIPAIDIIDGQCVRLSQGDYAQKKVYSSSPLEVAKQFEDAGIKYLHLVDLDGAKAKEIKNTAILESICSQTGLEVDFGGGIKSKDAAKIAFECGASKISCGSISITQRGLFLDILNTFGAERIILGADFKDGFMRSNGWLDKSDLKLDSFISDYIKEGVTTVIATDISKDGMLSGSSIEQYKNLLQNNDLELIASGGIHSLEELRALEETGCHGAIVGKAFYEGKISLSEITELC